jgi:hypothetical protein
MENAAEFENWLTQMIDDSKSKLSMTNETIAYILLKRGTEYYLKTICRHEVSNA